MDGANTQRIIRKCALSNRRRSPAGRGSDTNPTCPP